MAAAHFSRIMQPAYQDAEDAEEIQPLKHGCRFVNSYRDRLTTLYSKPETQHLPRNRWMVSEIRTYKDRKTKVKHEYLVATLKDQLEHTILFRIERRVRYKSLISFKQRVTDEISIIKPSDLNVKQLVEDIIFDPNSRVPSLPELIILACTVSDYSREYGDLAQYNYNCYWFCYVMTEYLKGHCSYNQPPKQGAWLLLPALGSYKIIDFDLLAEYYNKSWDGFKQDVCFIY
jgi:hypothetical protein